MVETFRGRETHQSSVTYPVSRTMAMSSGVLWSNEADQDLGANIHTKQRAS